MIRRYILALLALVATASAAMAQLTADWKLHMPFDAWPVQVVETPKRVYFMSRTFEENPMVTLRAEKSNSLFYYDKAGDEIISINERLNANGNAVSCIAYNAQKKYLLVVYVDCNIDFIYDDGRVYNLPALKSTSIPGKKSANHITFDNANGRAYVATSFGYLTLNDDRHEVAESRNYGENIRSAARCGDYIVLLGADNKIYHARAGEQRYNLSEYKVADGLPEVHALIPTNGNTFLAYKTTYPSSLQRFTRSGDTYAAEFLYEDPKMFGEQQTADGKTVLTGNVRLTTVNPDGSVTSVNRPQEEWGNPAASLNGSELWTLTSRKGLRRYKASGNDWSVAADYMRPNAPAAYLMSSGGYVPAYGVLAGANGIDLSFSETSQVSPVNVSGLKGGFWKEYGVPYSGVASLANISNYTGLSVDPQNPNYVYRGSMTGGLLRLNLANPADIMIFANPSNPFSNYPGFVKVAEDQTAWNQLCNVTPPSFDSSGTMWALYRNRNKDRGELWYWSAADRAATTSAATYRPMKSIPVPEKFNASNSDVMIALTKTKNMVVIGGFNNSGTLLFYDHNGTPDNTADDRYVYMERPYDQDGGGVNFLCVNRLYEDPESGMVWIMSQRGLFTVNPATVFDNPNQVNRIKVARNDGTNLADYLLNEINVNGMTSDGEGRKWFCTSNGLVCTSADGRTILGEFSTDNSYLPDNNVVAACYNPDNNSLLVGTGGGIAEMFPSGSGGGSSAASEGMRVYPNPVEPDYYGWVRIDNIADGSLVKVTDSKGGIVKELGPAQAGSVEWDVSGLNNTRVSTGVYYIMVSPSAGGDGKTEIAKILVLN